GAQVGQGVHEAGVQVGLVDARGTGVDVVVPDGIAGAQHQGRTRGNHGNAHVLVLADDVEVLGVEPVAVAAHAAVAAAHHVQLAVDGVDQAEAQVEHILGFGPSGVPDVHLSPLNVLGAELIALAAVHGGQAAPDPDLTML